MGGQKEGNSLSHLETVETTAHLWIVLTELIMQDKSNFTSADQM